VDHVLLTLLAVAAGASGPQPPQLSRQAAALVRPILAERIAAHAEEFDAAGNLRGKSRHSAVFQERFGKLLSTAGPAADEAIAALMWFYLGEGPGEELMCAAQKRGTRMVSHLRRFMPGPPVTGLEPIRPGIQAKQYEGREALRRIDAREDPGHCE
jgi:hypothetical protein